MDTKEKVLRNLSYGLYQIGVMDGQRPCGCIINTVFQVTSDNRCHQYAQGQLYMGID